MENLGAMADSRYTGFREITDCNILDLYCRHTEQGLCHLLTESLDIIEYMSEKLMAWSDYVAFVAGLAVCCLLIP